MSSTIRNRFQNEDKSAGMRDVALGPKVYDGERFGKMSERLKRHNIHIKTYDRSNTVFIIFFAFLAVVGIVIWVKLSGVARIR